MKFNRVYVCALTAALFVSTASAGIILQITPSIGPNGFTNANFISVGGYQDNAVKALQTSASTFGPAGTADYYQKLVGALTPTNVVITNGSPTFNSWLGNNAPPVPFNVEYGNMLFWGLHALGTAGTQFSLSQLTFSNNFFGVSGAPYAFAGGTFGIDLVGRNGGTFYNQGNPGTDATLVDEFWFSGLGDSFQFSAGCGYACIDAYARNNPFNYASATYVLAGTTAAATVGVVPEPATMSLCALGIAGLLFVRRKISL